MMQNSRLVNPVFALVCIAQVALADAAIGSTLPLSSITSDCLRAVLDCVVQASDSDLPLARWGKMEDPANDCKFVCSDETLAIQVPATHHALNPEVKNLLAPRVLQDVSGDFSIEVKVRCFEPLTGVSSTNPISSKDISVGSGILVWQNEKNFLRLTQAAMSDRQRKVIQLRVGEKLIFENAYDFNAEYLYLKVARVGKVFSVAVSEDGKRWLAPAVSQLPTLYDATYKFGDSLRTGVVVLNAINQEIQGEFKALRVVREAEYDVHDRLLTSWRFPRTLLTELRDPCVQQELRLQPELLAALLDYEAQQQKLPVASRTNENSPPALELAFKVWSSIKPMLSEQQSRRLAGLAIQKFGPRSLLTDIVQEQLKLDEHQLKSIANAREFLEESVALRNSSTANTPESREKYAALRLQANRLLTEVVSDKVQERADELCGDLLSFSLPGMITPEELESRHSLGPLADLLRQPAVQQELRLSLSVTEAIDSFLEIKSRDVNDVVASLDLDLSNQPSAQLQNAWWDAYRRIAVIRRELERECAKSLTAAQNSRLQQLLFQSLGPQVLLVSESAREALELTEQQLEDLRQIEQERAKSLNFANLLCNSVRRAADVGVLLSDQQRGKLQSLKGATFRFVAVTR